jgi:chorismate mutase
MSAADPTTAALRAEIDAADDTILHALEGRIEAVRALHEHKEAVGLALADPGREQEILDRLTAARSGQLSESGVANLVAAILGLTRDEVTRLRGRRWGA